MRLLHMMRWKGKLLGMERKYVYMTYKFVTRERTLSDHIRGICC